MTIKEVEQILKISRATVRFYEKEGLINPSREGNGYRDYSDQDVDKLRKIVILRKIGISVEDINDIFDGAKSINEVLDANIIKLKMQMSELKGAINLSKKMKEDDADISSLDTERYWNTIDEEEKQGNSFMNIAKDIADIEKGVIFSFFSWVDANGVPYDSFLKCISNLIIVIAIAGCVMYGLQGILSIIIIEVVLSIPLYFLGKKYLWIKNNRKKALTIICVVLAILLIILGSVFGK